MWDVPVSGVTVSFLKKTYAINLLYIISSATVRASIFFLYLRLFGHIRSTKFVIYAGLSTTFVFYLIVAIVHLNYCTPRSGEGWTLPPFMRCEDPEIRMSIAQAAFGSVFDLFLLLLPVLQVLRLNMPLRKRLGVAAIFTTGFLLVSQSAGSVRHFRPLTLEQCFWELSWLCGHSGSITSRHRHVLASHQGICLCVRETTLLHDCVMHMLTCHLYR